MDAVLAPQTSELTPASTSPTAHNLHTLVGEQQRSIWGKLCPAHGERGAKPLESKAAAAHVGSCVLWVCFVLWLVVEH
jgi:hypothetical protein